MMVFSRWRSSGRLGQLRGQLLQWGTPDFMVFTTTKDELRGWIQRSSGSSEGLVRRGKGLDRRIAPARQALLLSLLGSRTLYSELSKHLDYLIELSFQIVEFLDLLFRAETYHQPHSRCFG